MNILVVDDEPIMRQAYKTLFDWEGSGFCLAGVAHSGLEALEIMRRADIDIVITDIKMPEMTGIELIRTAKEEFPHVKFVVMSGYDEFSLVREAFVLGAREYFLKAEMEPERVMQTLVKLKEEPWDVKVSKADDKHAPDRQTNEQEQLFKEKLLKELVWGSNRKKTAAQLRNSGVNLEHDSLGIAVLSLVDYYNVEQSVWKSERELLKLALANVLNELCTAYGELYPLYNLPGEYLVMYPLNTRPDIRAFFKEVNDAFIKHFSLVCNLGLSTTSKDNVNPELVYREAKRACEFCFVSGNGSMLSYEEVRFRGTDINISSYTRKIKKALDSGESRQIRDIALKLRISADSVSLSQLSEVRNLFYLYYIEMHRFAEENNMAKSSLKSFYSFEGIRDNADLNTLNNWLLNSLTELGEALSDCGKVERAKHYIRHHYNEQLTLGIVADKLGISEGHLSRIFKQTENCGFSHFLLMTRMEVAKNLLATTNLKIYEVSRQVGYSNTEQFSKMFKKVFGVSPKSFMK